MKLKPILISCLLAGMAYFVSFCALAGAGYTYDARPGIPIIGNPNALMLFGTTLFVVPFCASAAYLRNALRFHPRRTTVITSTLIGIWAMEKIAIVGMSALIYGYGTDIQQLPKLLHRISAGGDPTAPWFTQRYILVTLVGCVILGFVSGLETRRDRRSVLPVER